MAYLNVPDPTANFRPLTWAGLFSLLPWAVLVIGLVISQ